MSDDLTQQAIQFALSGNWKQAIKINLALLKSNPKDTEIMNRLARAYLQTGQKTLAHRTYAKVLKIDKFNTIALKNLDLLKTLKIDRSVHRPPASSAPTPVFLEEPGSTKNVSLTRLGDDRIIGNLHPGDPVTILCREHNVVAISQTKQYLGRLPDDLAARLRTLLKAGNTYSAWIRSLDLSTPTHTVKIFIKEIYRCPKYRDTPSFPLVEKLSYAAFTPPELVHEEKPDVSATEYQEDDTSQNRHEPESEVQT